MGLPGSSMNLVSMFGGISALEEAFRQMGLHPKTWMWEIDPKALAISRKNFPNTMQMGSVAGQDWDRIAREIGRVDLLCGGFPCQDMSNMNPRGQGLRGERSGLFSEMVKAINAFQPRHFMVENVVPFDAMRNSDIRQISNILGVDPYLLNAADSSAMRRNRYIWTNLPVSPPPENAPGAMEFLGDRSMGFPVPHESYAKYERNPNPNAHTKHRIPILGPEGTTGDKFRTLLAKTSIMDVYKNAYQRGLGGLVEFVSPDIWYELFGFPKGYWHGAGVTPSQAMSKLGNSFSIHMVKRALENMPYDGGTAGDWQQRESGLIVPGEKKISVPERPKIEIYTPQGVKTVDPNPQRNPIEEVQKLFPFLDAKKIEQILSDPHWFMTPSQRAKTLASQKAEAMSGYATTQDMAGETTRGTALGQRRHAHFDENNMPIQYTNIQDQMKAAAESPYWKMAMEVLAKMNKAAEAAANKKSGGASIEQGTFFGSPFAANPKNLQMWIEMNGGISNALRKAAGQSKGAIQAEITRSSLLPFMTGLQRSGELLEQKGLVNITDDDLKETGKQAVKEAAMGWAAGKVPFLAPAMMGGEWGEKNLSNYMPPEWAYTTGYLGGIGAEAAVAPAVGAALGTKMAVDTLSPWYRMGTKGLPPAIPAPGGLGGYGFDYK